MLKKVEVLAKVAVIITSVLPCSVLVREYFLLAGNNVAPIKALQAVGEITTEVVPSSLSSIGVSDTPALLLVDRNGSVAAL